MNRHRESNRIYPGNRPRPPRPPIRRGREPPRLGRSVSRVREAAMASCSAVHCCCVRSVRLGGQELDAAIEERVADAAQALPAPVMSAADG